MEIKTINLNELLKKLLFKNGIFMRMDIVIKYLAFENWQNLSEIDLTYWKMQFLKLKVLDKINSVSIINQINRFINIAAAAAFTNRKEVEPITIGNDFGLLDGAHRIAFSMFYNFTHIKYYQAANKKGVPGSWLNSNLIQQFTTEEIIRIETCKDNLLSDLENRRWS